MTVEPSRMSAGGSVRPTLTSNVPVMGSACGETSRTRPVAVTPAASVRLTVISGIARRRPEQLSRHIEHGIAAACQRDPNDQLSGLHHFAGLRRGRGHDAGGIRVQRGVAHPVLGSLQLRLRDVDLSPRRFLLLLRLLELGARRDAGGEQRLLTLEVACGLGDSCLGRHEIGLRRTQSVLLVLRLDPGYQLSGLDAIADIHRPFDQPSSKAEGQTRLGFGLDAPGIGDGLADLPLHDGHGANRTNFRRG